MATSTQHLPARTESTTGIPWYLWCSALAVTSVTIGAHWDVSWHRSIGRDNFLDTRSYRNLSLRHTRGNRLRLSDLPHDLQPQCGTERGHRPGPRLQRSARRLSRRVGRSRHDHLSPVRQLVAQRLRPRRQNHQPAPHHPGPRHLRRRNRFALPHHVRDEPRAG